MLCKMYKGYQKKSFWALLLFAGLVFLAFGIVSYLLLPEDSVCLATLSGFSAGLGGALAAAAVIRLIWLQISTPEQLKLEEIKRNDERNIQIFRRAMLIVGYLSFFLLAAMSLTFSMLGYAVAGWIAIGGLYLECIVFVLAHAVISRKM
ncbi:MAG: hypothetical protein HFE86_07795 [Clostridiales bacterium]|nr:hypothetical protein [Clostridiales bacterium]